MTEQLSVLEWAEERLANTLHIAPTKTGDDRAGWLEDAAYWSAIVDELREVRRLRAELQAAQELHRECYRWMNALNGEDDDGALPTLGAMLDKLAQAHPTPAQEGQS